MIRPLSGECVLERRFAGEVQARRLHEQPVSEGMFDDKTYETGRVRTVMGITGIIY